MQNLKANVLWNDTIQKVVQYINLQKNCIEAELKNLHNFNPDEEVAKFAKKNSYGTTISKKVVQNVNMQRVRQVAKAQF